MSMCPSVLRGAESSPVLAGTVQSSPVTVSPSGSPGGSQYDSDSDMAFSVNRSSSASESSLGKEGLVRGCQVGSTVGCGYGLVEDAGPCMGKALEGRALNIDLGMVIESLRLENTIEIT